MGTLTLKNNIDSEFSITHTNNAGPITINSKDLASTKLIDSIAELKLISGASADKLEVLGYYAKGDGGGGTFYWDSTSTESENGGTIIQATGITTGRWKRHISRTINVKWFGAKGDGITDDTIAIQNSLNVNGMIEGGNDEYLIGSSISLNVPDKDITINNINFKLKDGNWLSAMIFITASKSLTLNNIKFNGNRVNVTGNNAGFIVARNTENITVNNIHINDLRRYALNFDINVKNIEIKNIIAADCGVTGTALGEVVKIENAENVDIENFTYTNPSQTGDGQILKVFHSKNVNLLNINITDASPSYIYPSCSMVRNENLIWKNVLIDGKSQVAIEDNANLKASYFNIKTNTRKACIMSTDGASQGNRRAEDVYIKSWKDTSTEEKAFNLVGVYKLKIENLITNTTLNISRDSPEANNRTEFLTLKNIQCNNLNTLSITPPMSIEKSTITNLWLNTGVGEFLSIDTTYLSYSNGGSTPAILVEKISTFKDIYRYKGTLDASTSIEIFAPLSISFLPFRADISGYFSFSSSLANQWSKIEFDVYDGGTPTGNKRVIVSGTTARSLITATPNRGLKKITITNSETVQILYSFNIQYYS